MKILSIDTSSNVCSVAVLEDTKLLKETSNNNGHTHSETLMPIIQKLLTDLKINLADIQLIVCDKGPGSFTGIRIGVATTMGFADCLNIPSTGISSLEALAYNVQENGMICSLIDAKNENSYYGIFIKKDSLYTQERALSVANIDEILHILSTYEQPITFVGDGSIVYKEKISQKFSTSKFIEKNNLSAYKLGIAGLLKYQSTGLQSVIPLYLRKPQAERMLEEKLKNGK